MKTRDLENTLNNVHDQKSLTQYIQTIQDISYDSFHEYFNQLIQDALFKDLVDICKNAIVILSISSVKINRHWQFNDISAYEWYLFHH